MLVCILLVLLPFCNFNSYLSIAFMWIKKICHFRYWVQKSVKQRKCCSNCKVSELALYCQYGAYQVKRCVAFFALSACDLVADDFLWHGSHEGLSHPGKR